MTAALHTKARTPRLFPNRAKLLAASIALICAANLPGRLFGQWTGGPTGPIYYNGGNVGIGPTFSSTSPYDLLDVGDNAFGLALNGKHLTVTSTSTNSGVNVGQSSGNRGRILWNYNANPAAAYMSVEVPYGANPLVLQSMGGNVGIGTTSPQHLLHVAGTIGAGTQLTGASLTLRKGSIVQIIALDPAGLVHPPSALVAAPSGHYFFPSVTTAAGYFSSARLTANAAGQHTYSVTIPNGTTVQLFIDSDLIITDATGHTVPLRTPSGITATGGGPLTPITVSLSN